MIHTRHLVSAAALLALAAAPARPVAAAAAPSASGGEAELFALDEELKTETDVASQRARTVRETPGVVTVITREQIQASGARDLEEVLLLVPGFHFGLDIEGVVGVGFRGNWGHEGKVLLLVDGLEMNELLFSTLQFGNHYALDNVKSVEVIRGPGSAIYGGNAELAVVNVVTRGAEDLAGLAASATYGRMEDGPAHQSVGLAGGRRFGDLAVAAHALLGQGHRSDATYRDPSGTPWTMAGTAGLDPATVNASASWRGLALRFLHDDFTVSSASAYGEVVPRVEPVLFRSSIADARYEIRLGERVRITPRYTWKRQITWQNTTGTIDDFLYDRSAERHTARLLGTWDAARRLSFTAGAETSLDRAWSTPDPSDLQHFAAVAGIAEATWDTAVANLLAGARIERHERYGTAFVPRLALTKLLEPFHLKLLYSNAFRAPSVEIINTTPDIQPEYTRVVEAELGWRVSDHLYAAVNAFDQTVEDTIVYGVEVTTEGYANAARTGSRGVELDLRLRHRLGQAAVGYSFYTARGKNEIASYAVPGQDALTLAFPAHKVTVSGQVELARKVTLSPSAVWMSSRYAHAGVDGGTGEALASRIEPKLYLSLFLSWRDALVRGLELGLGVSDLLDTGTVYVQPYDGGHAPLPGASRAWYLRLGYTLPL